MITQNDLDIENLSYTKKDFGQIYPELLDLAKQLSSKWDPENTNESDPGIVLLKLAAFIADKNNYNIDKNVLEQFLTSCTQDTSMNRLCELIGYNRHYYRSATTRISFRYTGKLNDTSAQTSSVSHYSSFNIKALGDTPTTFKTEDGIIYTLLENIGDVTEDNRLFTGKLAIEGELNTLKVLNNKKIQLQNLDSNNRIYFPDVEVAENGIVIDGEYYTSTNPDAWHRVDNLNDQPLHSKVFKFGYDSEKGFPYLQFPEDISNLIGEGLEIKYIISKGTLGKVSQGDLSTFDAISITAGEQSSTAISLDEGTYVIVNSSSIGAEDPETLTESYNAAKKVVGTFETLVSAQDYSNYLNNYTDDSNNKVISNVVATDIRTDPSYSTTVFSRNPLGGTQSYYKTTLNTDKATTASFYITLHGFTPVNKDINTKLTYETTYSNITNSDVIEAETAIADVKSIAQFIKTPDDFNVILGNYTLNANITPTYKVNLSEEQEIINNVKTALYENFNSQKLDFGEEIPYDSLVEVIQGSDERIKTVSLAEPEINYTYKKISDETPVTLNTAADNMLVSLVANNILAGAMPLYYEDTSFNYDYNMSNIKDHGSLRGVRASFTIAANNERTLAKHEAVQILTDSFITKLTYPVGVYYSFKAGSSSTARPQKDTPYTLQDGDVLYIAYTDSSDNAQFIKYTKDSKDYTTFISSFTMTDCAHSGETGGEDSKSASKFLNENGKVVEGATAKNPGDAICMYYLGTKEQIEMVTRNSYTLPKRSKAFWLIQPRVASNGSISNEKGSLIFTKIDDTYTYILEENEYFIYPSDDLLSINLCGPGTKLLLNTESTTTQDSISIDRSSNTAIDLTELMDATEDGDVGTFENAFAWETLSPQYSIEVVETSITTIAEGDKVLSNINLTSIWAPLTNKKINETTYTPNQNGLARTVASFTCSSAEPYSKSTDWDLTFYNSDGEKVSDTESLIQTSIEVDSYNDLIFLGTLQYVTKGSTLQPKIDAGGNYEYKYSCKMQSYAERDYTNQANTVLGVYDLICAALGSNATTNSRDEYVFTATKLRALSAIPDKLNINFSDSACKINVFDTCSGKTLLLDNTGEIDLTPFKTGGAATDADSLYISKPKNLALQSYLSEVDASFEGAIIATVKATPTYDYLGEKNTYKYISSYTPLYSFFDENNIYNKFTIAKIDFDSSKFNVIGGNLKYVKN